MVLVLVLIFFSVGDQSFGSPDPPPDIVTVFTSQVGEYDKYIFFVERGSFGLCSPYYPSYPTGQRTRLSTYFLGGVWEVT